MNTLDIEKAKEIREAITAGEKALKSVEAARRQLHSASNWGLVDIFGGGLLTDVIKHSKISKANDLMTQMQYDLKQFQKELGDIQMEINYNIDISSTMYMFDILFDNVFADVMVQGKINEALNSVESLKLTIENIVKDLKTHLTKY